MISMSQVISIADAYDRENVSVGTIGSHSALEVMDGCKDEGLKTVCVCQKGRETPYLRFRRLTDEILLLEKFSDILYKENIQRLIDLNTIFVTNRAFTAYLGYENIEKKFLVPLFGNRYLLRAEEREEEYNQYTLLEQANIRHPTIFDDPSEIKGLAIVKIPEATRKLERAFFIVSSYDDFIRKSEIRIEKGVISRNDLKNAIIEEYVIGTYFNFNFFYSPLKKEMEFLGIERRLQTNLHDFTTSIPAKEQLEMDIDLQNIEVGHMPASIRESLLEKVFLIGDRFAHFVNSKYSPGIIGPISLQSVVTRDLELIVYDVSLRVPGNPIMATTSPYTKYSHGFVLGVGRRIAMEISEALNKNKIREIIT
jgi:5-formaminoimidazole-4-carboxamide-1-(beta)-D-ribofuranosyl 5'-monophosphate synthetase